MLIASSRSPACLQLTSILPQLTHRYNLPEVEVKQAVASALELVNMQDAMSRGTHTLSGGQRQRVAIAGQYEDLQQQQQY
jgi:ABC-type methionine transport system ATPase subunit